MDYEWRVNAANAGALAGTLCREWDRAVLFRTLATFRTDIALFQDGAVALERLHTRVRLSCGSIRHGDYENRTTCGTSAPQRAGPRILRVWGTRTSVGICPPTQLKCPKASHLPLLS